MKKISTFISVVALGIVALFLLSFGQYIANKSNSEPAPVVQEEEVIKEKVDVSGTWHSNDDFSYIITFNADGTYEDIYDGETLQTGDWVVLESLEGEDIDVQGGFSDSFYLKVSGDEDPFYYSILSVDETELQLIYLSRGNILTFTKVVE